MTWHPWRELRHRAHVRLHQVDLGDDVAGRTNGHDVIEMSTGLLQVERRCTLAHELVHLERGHTGPCTPAEEESVAREAARRLIPMHALLRAVAFYGEDWPAVADEVWVDEPTLAARLDSLHPAERGALRRTLQMREASA